MVYKNLNVSHIFTVPYPHWSYSAVKRLEKELSCVLRWVCSETQLRSELFTDPLSLVQSVLSNALSSQHGNIPPLTAFTALDPRLSILSFSRSPMAAIVRRSDLQREHALHISILQSKMADRGPISQYPVQSGRKRWIMTLSLSCAVLPKVSEEPFVLVARHQFTARKKLFFSRRSLRQVIKALSNYVYGLEGIQNGLHRYVHGYCIKFYHDASLDTEGIKSHVVPCKAGMPGQLHMLLVDSNDVLEVHVYWKGPPESGETTELIAKVYEVVPQ